jgi:single-strand DNA-binding protein
MYHKVVLVGNLGRDPELRYTPSGQAVCNLNVATNRAYTKSDGDTVEETVWFRVTAWGRLAETSAQYLYKGRQVLVEGRLTPDENGNPKIWERADGSPGASFEVNAQNIRFLGSNANGAGATEEEEEVPAADEIPF